MSLSGAWRVALTEIRYDGNKKMDLYVYTDICSPSYVSNNCLVILHIINKTTIVESPYFLPLSRNDISHLRIYIRTRNNEITSFNPRSLRCMLRLEQL